MHKYQTRSKRARVSKQVSSKHFSHRIYLNAIRESSPKPSASGAQPFSKIEAQSGAQPALFCNFAVCFRTTKFIPELDKGDR